MQSKLSAPHFHFEDAAFAYVEVKLWPNGPVCHHCGGTERIGKLRGEGASARPLQMLRMPEAIHCPYGKNFSGNDALYGHTHRVGIPA